MNKLVTILIVTFVFFAFLPTEVYGHILDTDGTIGAVLHVSPDDDPIVSEPATFIFQIKDTTQKFDPAMCTCSFKILQNKTTIHEETLTEPKQSAEYVVKYSFPARGIYTIEIAGIASHNMFQNFNLKYDLRVERTNSTAVDSPKSNINNFLPLLLVPIGVVASLGILQLLTKRKH
jgi:hypothetical protein